MEVKTAPTFFFYAFLFQIMPTNATVAVHLDFLYATQFPTILIQTKIKMIAPIVYTSYNFVYRKLKKDMTYDFVVYSLYVL